VFIYKSDLAATNLPNLRFLVCSTGYVVGDGRNQETVCNFPCAIACPCQRGIGGNTRIREVKGAIFKKRHATGWRHGPSADNVLPQLGVAATTTPDKQGRCKDKCVNTHKHSMPIKSWATPHQNATTT